MDKQLITSNLNVEASAALESIVVHAELDSTNSEAARLLDEGSKGAMLVVADSQTAGRGRRGRDWASPAGSGLYMSMSYPFEKKGLQLQALSLVAALCTCQTLSDLGFSGIQSKWPNDLLVGKKKLAGILLEMKHANNTDHIIFGIGVNYALSHEQKAGIDKPVIDLQEIAGAELKRLVSRELIAAKICSNLILSIEQFLHSGFRPFQSSWNELDRYFQSDIVVDNGTQRTIGKSLGVDENGVLQLLTAEGRQSINAGEIFPSLRSAHDDSE